MTEAPTYPQAIKSQKDIQEILKNGHRFSGKYFNFIYTKRINPKCQMQLLISIPKKNIKLAVNRNAIKRKIKAFDFKKKINLNTNLNLIIVYKYFKPVKYVKLESDILAFFNSIQK